MHKQNNGQADPLKQLLSEAMHLSDNKLCQECHSRGPHTWASWNIGVFLCIRCAGIHRKLGVHLSKVKSCTLDQWQACQVDSIITKGNKQAWLYYEHSLPKGHMRPNDTSALEVFIRNKYERKMYNPRDGSVQPPGEQLSESSPPPEAKKPTPEIEKERIVLEKRVKKLEKVSKNATNSLPLPSAPSRPRSQPSSPAKPESMGPGGDSLLLDIGNGMISSRSESDFAFLDDVEKLFFNRSSKPGPPSNVSPLQVPSVQKIDFLEPLVQPADRLQMDTNQIMSLYQVPAQAGGSRMGPNYAPRYAAPQHQYFNANTAVYQQQQKLVSEAAEIQKTIDAMKGESRLQASAPANGTEGNDPWEQPLANGAPSQSGETLSNDLWL